MSKKTKPVEEQETIPLLASLNGADVELVLVPTDQFPSDSKLHGPAPSQQFIADVRMRGIIYPIIALRNADGSYDVRDGRNRIKTARILQLPSLRTLVYSGVGVHEAMTITTAANAHRRSNPLADLNILRCLERDNKPARISGLPAATIKKLKKLGQLDPQFIDAVENGQMSVATAEALATLDRKQLKTLRDMAAAGEHISSKDVADAKRVQTAEAASQFDALLNTSMESETIYYVAANVAGGQVGEPKANLEVAREVAKQYGGGFKAYRLVEA